MIAVAGSPVYAMQSVLYESPDLTNYQQRANVEAFLPSDLKHLTVVVGLFDQNLFD